MAGTACSTLARPKTTETRKTNLSVVILTFNEERNLPACLESIQGLNAEVFVIDSGSSDRTLEIAKEYKTTILSHPFETHAKQWLWALEALPTTTNWVLGLDADQRLTPDLAQEIRTELGARSREQGARSEELSAKGTGQGAKSLELGVRRQEPRLREPGAGTTERLEQVGGFYIKRRQIFRGRWIRYGGYYPKYLLKLFRRDRVRIDPNDLMDHHFYVDGRVAMLQYDLIEANKKEDDISFWIEKHNRYATLVAREELQRREETQHNFLQASLVGNPDQRTLRLKQLWWRLPLFVRPFLYFFYRYFIRLGILDGKEGFIFHFMQAFWFRLLVDIKIEELQQ